jgi:hypothetical protein
LAGQRRRGIAGFKVEVFVVEAFAVVGTAVVSHGHRKTTEGERVFEFKNWREQATEGD